tara:strand:+ start:1653 stop:1868 length:216 start_codon:yes stop_codon:yes gene_type:complete
MSAEITPEVELELNIYELVQLAHRVRRQIHRTTFEQREELEGIGGLLMSLGATDTLPPCPSTQPDTKETAA